MDNTKISKGLAAQNKMTYIFDKEMGVRLTYARRKMRMKQDDLARMLGISQDKVSRIECGSIKNGIVSTLTVSRFNAILGVHKNYVIMGAKHEEYERFRKIGLGHFGEIVSK